MTDYNELSLEELQKLKEDRKKQELIAEMKAEDEAKAKAEKEAYEAQVAAQAIEDYKNSLETPDPKLKQTLSKGNTEIKTNEYVDYLKKFTGGELKTYEGLGEDTFNFTNSDSDCDTTVASWSPADTYVNAIWHAMYEKADLFKIAVKGLNLKAGDGMSVQIRTIGKFGDPSNVAACECISCSSPALSTYTLNLEQYGISTEICEEDVWDVGEKYRSAMLKSMGATWAEYFNSLIYAEVEGATPGYTSNIATGDLSCDFAIGGSCCTDTTLMTMYNALDEVITDMRSANYAPDYIILHPEISRMFRAIQNPSPIFASTVEIGKNGSLKSFLGVEVIEYTGANDCSDATSGDVVAVVVDSTRAVGAAFGQRPKLESDRNIDCNSTTYAMWAFFATDELDTNAIGHVVSS